MSTVYSKFKVGGKYLDTVGHTWVVMSIRQVSLNTRVLLVKANKPLTNLWEVAVIDNLIPSQASILMDEGFTTLYADQEI